MTTPIKLLYLEDDEVDRKAFLRMIGEKRLPYEVTHAANIAQARARLGESCFDVIVADYHLPDGECTELFEEVKEIPFVLLTGTLEEQLALRTLERGADDYLAKDPQQRHLEAVPFTVEKTLHRKHLRERELQLSRQLLHSEERFRLLVESVKDYAIYMLDREGCVTTWNVGAERINGYKASEILGRSFSVFFLPEDVAAGKPQRELEMAVHDGSFHEEGLRIRKDGSLFWAEVTVTALKDDHGELIGFGKVTRDVTERKRAEQALQESEAKLQLALNAAALGMWDWDLFSDKVEMNDECRALFGIGPGTEMDYPRYLQAVHPTDRQRVDEAVSQAVELRSLYNVEMRTLWPDGSEHWLCSVGRAFYDRSGKAVRMAGVAFDLAAHNRQPLEIIAGIAGKVS